MFIQILCIVFSDKKSSRFHGFGFQSFNKDFLTLKDSFLLNIYKSLYLIIIYN